MYIINWSRAEIMTDRDYGQTPNGKIDKCIQFYASCTVFCSFWATLRYSNNEALQE